jgi:hypothetical protein
MSTGRSRSYCGGGAPSRSPHRSHLKSAWSVRQLTPDADSPRSTRAWLSGDARSPASRRVPLLSELLRVRHRSARAPRRLTRKLARTPPNRAVSPIPSRRIRSGALKAPRLRAHQFYGQALLPRVAADGDRHHRSAPVLPEQRGSPTTNDRRLDHSSCRARR